MLRGRGSFNADQRWRYDPGTVKIMSNVEEERIRKLLLGILNSFQFLK
jgi:hypothetical protein